MRPYWKGTHVEVCSPPVCRGRGKERETWRFAVEGSQLVLVAYWVEMLPTRRHKRWREVASIGRWPGLHASNGIATLQDAPMTNVLAAAILDAVTPTLTIRSPGHTSLPTLGYRLRERHAEATATGGVERGVGTPDDAGA
jgi:hypothetical protein